MSEGKKDEAVLQQTVCAGLEGIEQVVDYLNNATAEVKKLIKEECDVIYECRFCRNLFRSIINFVSHKRAYCRSLHQKIETSLEDARRQSNNSPEAVEDDDDENSSHGSEQSSNGNGNSEPPILASPNRRQMLDGFPKKLGKRKVGRKNLGNLRVINPLTRVTKRLGTTTLKNSSGEPVLQLHTLPSIAKVVPETRFENGVQVVGELPAGMAEKECKDKKEEKVFVVMPQDLSSRYVNMQLRNRSFRKNNAAPVTKELSSKEIAIIDRFTDNSVQFNVENTTCLHCNKSFLDFEVLAYHVTTRHSRVGPGEDSVLCFLCGRRYRNQASIRTHFHRDHKEVQLRVAKLKKTGGFESPTRKERQSADDTGDTRGRTRVINVSVAPEKDPDEENDQEESISDVSDIESDDEEMANLPPMLQKMPGEETSGANQRISLDEVLTRLHKNPCPSCDRKFIDIKNLELHKRVCTGNTGGDKEKKLALKKEDVVVKKNPVGRPPKKPRKTTPTWNGGGNEVSSEPSRSRSITPQKATAAPDDSSKRISARLAEKTEQRIVDGEPLSVVDQAVIKKDRALSETPVKPPSATKKEQQRIIAGTEEQEEEEEDSDENREEVEEIDEKEKEEFRKKEELKEKRKTQIDEVLRNSREILEAQPSAASPEKVAEKKESPIAAVLNEIDEKLNMDISSSSRSDLVVKQVVVPPSGAPVTAAVAPTTYKLTSAPTIIRRSPNKNASQTSPFRPSTGSASGNSGGEKGLAYVGTDSNSYLNKQKRAARKSLGFGTSISAPRIKEGGEHSTYNSLKAVVGNKEKLSGKFASRPNLRTSSSVPNAVINGKTKQKSTGKEQTAVAVKKKVSLGKSVPKKKDNTSKGVGGAGNDRRRRSLRTPARYAGEDWDLGYQSGNSGRKNEKATPNNKEVDNEKSSEVTTATGKGPSPKGKKEPQELKRKSTSIPAKPAEKKIRKKAEDRKVSSPEASSEEDRGAAPKGYCWVGCALVPEKPLQLDFTSDSGSSSGEEEEEKKDNRKTKTDSTPAPPAKKSMALPVVKVSSAASAGPPKLTTPTSATVKTKSVSAPVSAPAKTCPCGKCTGPPSMYEGLRSTPVYLTNQQQEILKWVMDDQQGVCYLCQVKFLRLETARRHIMNHLDFARFVCTQCQAAAFFVSDMRRHLMEPGLCKGVTDEVRKSNFPVGMSPNYHEKADTLVRHCYKEKPGRVMHWRGKVRLF